MKQASAGKHPCKTLKKGVAPTLKRFRTGDFHGFAPLPKKKGVPPLAGIVRGFGNAPGAMGGTCRLLSPPMPWRARALLLAGICKERNGKQRAAVVIGWAVAKEYLFPRRTQLAKGYAAPSYTLAEKAIEDVGISKEYFKGLVEWAAKKHMEQGVAQIAGKNSSVAAANFNAAIMIAMRGGLTELVGKLAKEIITLLEGAGENEAAQRIESTYLQTGVEPTKENVAARTMRIMDSARTNQKERETFNAGVLAKVHFLNGNYPEAQKQAQIAGLDAGQVWAAAAELREEIEHAKAYAKSTKVLAHKGRSPQ